MATRAKTLDNQTKHLTAKEIAAREEAENSLTPSRSKKREIDREPPRDLAKPVKTVWRRILRRTSDIELLEDADIDVLTVYCSMVVRINTLRETVDTLSERLTDPLEGMEVKDWISCLNKLDSLTGKIQKQEALLLSYADKLGLTPAGRAHLAKKRAEAAEDDTEGGLFA